MALQNIIFIEIEIQLVFHYNHIEADSLRAKLKKGLYMENAQEKIELSIVLPVYNEQNSIEKLYSRIKKVLNSLNKSYEIIFVDDGSTDNSADMVKKLAKTDPTVKLIILRRNFGQTPALAAGFDFASGEIIIAMDADLQHDPYEIPLFIEKINEGYDIVSGWRARRMDSFIIRRIPSLVANRLMRWLSGVDIHDFGTTFKAYRAEVIKNVNLYGELHRFIPALASSVGAKITEIPIKNITRPYGKSKYGISRTIRVLFDLLTVKFLLNYLTRPLQFFGLIGLSCFVLGGIMGLYLFWRKFIESADIMVHHGPLLLLTIFLIIIGANFISIGLLGEVLSRIYHESTDRKIYYVREVWTGGSKNSEQTENKIS